MTFTPRSTSASHTCRPTLPPPSTTACRPGCASCVEASRSSRLRSPCTPDRPRAGISTVVACAPVATIRAGRTRSRGRLSSASRRRDASRPVARDAAQDGRADLLLEVVGGRQRSSAARQPAGQRVGQQRPRVVRSVVGRHDRDGASGRVFARGLARGDAGRRRTDDDDVAVEFGPGTLRSVCLRRQARASGTPRRTPASPARRTRRSAPPDRAPRSGRMPYGQTIRHIRQPTHRSSSSTTRPSVGASVQRAALAAEDAERLVALLAAQRLDAVLGPHDRDATLGGGAARRWRRRAVARASGPRRTPARSCGRPGTVRD